METNKKKLVTHNGSFHADDIFASAALSLMLEAKGGSFEIIRTRNPEIIKEGDYVFDVGGIYDASANRFDHHQKDFQEKRSASPPASLRQGGENGMENGIMYSSFGLVWKKFGGELCGSEKAREVVDKKLVSPIDANDNGFDLVENKYDISPYSIESFFYSMRPSWSESDLDNDQMFFKCVEIAKEVLSREIIRAKDFITAEEKIIKNYQDANDKRIVILDKDYFYESVLNKFSEPLFVIYPRTDNVSFAVRAIREESKSFKNRKNFPKEWGALRDEELQKVTGVQDAIFCHRALFLAVAKSKEGAIKLAELALK